MMPGRNRRARTGVARVAGVGVRAGIGTGALAILLALTSCAPFGGSTTTATSTPAPVPATIDPALTEFYSQTLIWEGCGDELQCSTAEVPLDYASPEGERASIALVRHQATNGDPIGSLLVNPGGPGGSGVELVAESLDYAVDDTLQENYDIVGFDPRGVGESSAVRCYDAKEMDSYLYDITPGERGSDEWLAASRASATAFAAACSAGTGDLLASVDTVSAARDLDVLRAALGDTTLSYLGYSYGTYLGATYAGLFPENAGRLVLDGALDPATTNAQVVTEQAIGFESALRAYLADCLGSTGCPFTGSVEDGMAAVGELLATVDASPLRAADGRSLGGNSLLTAIIYPLYSASSWSALSEMFAAVRKGDPTTAFQFADAYNGRTSSGTYRDNSTEAFLAINCLDYAYTSDPAVLRQQAAELEQAAPVIGRYMSYGDIQCDAWPTASTRDRAQITAEGAAPILVIGTTNDPATPYVWAESLADQLESGVLVTYEGEGHTAYNKSNSCVNDTVDAFLVEGTVPASDPLC